MRIGVSEHTSSPVPLGDAFEAWVMQGVELSIEPTTPMATTIAVMSTSNTGSLLVATSVERPAAVPHGPLTAIDEARHPRPSRVIPLPSADG